MIKSFEFFIKEIKVIKKTYGNQYFKKSELHAVINDLSPRLDKKFINVLKKADDFSLCIKISNLETENDSIKTIELAKYRQDFVENSGLDNTLAILIFDTYLFGIDLLEDFKFEASIYSINQTCANNLNRLTNNLTNFDIVIIGDQIWNSKNLSIKHFLNGDQIPIAKSSEDWVKAGLEKQPACCAYENDEKNEIQFGLMYNWWVINDPRGFVPEGYKIPSKEDFEILKKNIGKNGNLLKSIIYRDGLDSFGFSAIPGGFRSHKGIFKEKGKGFYIWSLSSGKGFSGKEAHYLRLYEYINSIRVFLENKNIGFYIRTLKIN